MDVIIGNLCSLFATVSDIVSSSRKKARDFLLVQCISQFFYGLGGIVLKGYSATVQNAICLIRNLTAAYDVKSKVLEWGFVVLAVALGLAFNNLGIIGLLPVVANLIYSLAVVLFRKQEVLLKGAFLINVAMYVVFNGMIMNYVGMVANTILFVTTLLFLLRHIRSEKKQAEEE